MRRNRKEAVVVARDAAGDRSLWNCTDIMPREVCAEVDLPQGSTYAQGGTGAAPHLTQ